MIFEELKDFWQDESGQDMVEYSLLLAFIALAAVALLTGIRTNIKGIFTSVSSALSTGAT